MNGKDLVDKLKGKMSATTNKSLADKLGVTPASITQWKNTRTLSVAQIANIVRASSKRARADAYSTALKPVVEFFPLDPIPSKQGVKSELFATGKDGNPLHKGLRRALDRAKGIYIFYDSRGRAIYAGKAAKQSLWKEIKSAFNRDRKTQRVYRVNHPTRRQSFASATDRPRQPQLQQVRLDDLAAYVTAYEVDNTMINELEALLVRCFANDLLNARMEKFGGGQATSHRKQARRPHA